MNSSVLPSINLIEKPKARYGLASAWNRILARIIDQLILLLIVIGFAYIIIASDSNVDKWKGELNQTWRYLIISLTTTIFFVGYFILVPIWTKGRTIAFLIFKLRLYNLISTKNFFINIIKREFFLWMVGILAVLILGIILCILNKDDAYNFWQAMLSPSTDNMNNITKIGITFIYALYGVNLFMVLFVAIHMCMNNRKRCFIDHISDTVVIKLIDISSNDPSTSTNIKRTSKRNYGLPGEILGGASDEINSL